MTYSRIAGTGRYLPEKILTNFDLEKIVDTSDEWIRTRTGVERRHCVAPDQTTSDMCVEAAKVAMEEAGVEPEDIEMVVIGTTSPDLIFPNAATLVQHRLGIPACSACHGPAGEGNPFSGYPALAGQHSDYVAKMMNGFRSGTTWGGADAPSRIMTEVASRLTDAEIAAVSSYIEGLHRAE